MNIKERVAHYEKLFELFNERSIELNKADIQQIKAELKRLWRIEECAKRTEAQLAVAVAALEFVGNYHEEYTVCGSNIKSALAEIAAIADEGRTSETRGGEE